MKFEATTDPREKSTKPEPSWPSGDAQAVYDGRHHRGFVSKRPDGVYVAVAVGGAAIGTFESRARAFAAVIDSERASEKAAP